MFEIIYLLAQLEIPNISLEDVMCMSTNIYYEARSEPLTGRIAVGNVVLNRVISSKYPDTVCGVVYQAQYDPIKYIPIKYKCQFSWFCDGLSDIPINRKKFKEVSILSFLILIGAYGDNTYGATHYYNPVIANPNWAKKYNYTVSYAKHDFYARTD